MNAAGGDAAALIRWLDPQPDRASLPQKLSDPFEAPHPVARDAALALQERLREGPIAPGIPTDILNRPQGGKMFGVLVVATSDGRVGVLQAFSGQLGTVWNAPGWVPPMFDVRLRESVQPAGEAAIKTLTANMEALSRSEAFCRAREELEAFDRERAVELRAAEAARQQRRQMRRDARAALGPADGAQRFRLDEESERDHRDRRVLEARWREERRRAAQPYERLKRRLGAMSRLRAYIARRTMQRVHETYRLTSPTGEIRTVRDLFAPAEPPWGTGDCAAPKLIVFAHRHQLTPLALAEFWWGPPSRGGERSEGRFFPPCETKCGPVLSFLLGNVVR